MTIVLTDSIDADMAVELINQGQIFRYLRKPVDDSVLQRSVTQAFQFYQVNKKKPKLLERAKVEKSTNVHNSSLADKLSLHIKSLRKRFSFGF